MNAGFFSNGTPFFHVVAQNVSTALSEDWGTVGDITSRLVPECATIRADLLVFDSAVLCGRAWFDQALIQVDPTITVHWFFRDGDRLNSGDRVAALAGRARSLFAAERVALNFLQMLSGVATRTADFVERVQGTSCKIYDSRKTIPGLRAAQKYAVACGGGNNHRFGLYDLVLIKDNHIAAAGGVAAAVASIRSILVELDLANSPIMVEVDTLDQMHAALAASVPMILLDNMSVQLVRAAVELNQGRAVLEASGGISEDTVQAYAQTGVDRISVGSLTKLLLPVDFSLQVRE